MFLTFEEKRLKIQKEYLNAEYTTKWFCLKRRTTKIRGKREVFVGIPDPAVIDNGIETSKYNLVTFLPKNLLVQFSKLANIYFIFVGVCQIIPAFSTTDGQPLVYMPLGMVIVMSMIKDFFEDRKRKAQDDLENNSIAQKLSPETNEFHEVPWKSIKIGDIIKVMEDEKLPADVLILSTSADKGTCFIETKNLDGEANLKFRQSCSAKLFQKNPDFNNLENCGRFSITYEDPNCEIHSFSGVLIDKNEEYENNPNSHSNRHLLGLQNICLRGCILKRTHWITGVVIYTGHDCKSLLYTNIPKYKFGTMERKMSYMVLEVFGMLIIISILMAIYYAVWWSYKQSELDYYLYIDVDSFAEIFFLHIPMWLLLLNTFVPISLLVTLELVRYLQGQFLQRDNSFKNQENELEPIGVASSNLLDELGTVRYILTDKTGTLTCNSMKFKALTVDEDIFEHAKYDDNGILASDQLLQKLADPKTFPIVFETFICMNLCHSLIVEEKNGKKHYSGSSSDEECIMEFCVSCGMYYEGIDENKIMTVVNTLNNLKYKFRVISVREYSSDLGKMSILVEDLQDGLFKMYTKGASNKVFNSLRSDQSEIQKITEKHIDHFAIQILRTLCYSKRTLTQEEIAQFLSLEKKLTEQSKCISVHEIQHQLFKGIENEQVLLGGSGVNDEFSDQVENTLQNLKEAGIKIWMITGDKRETGVSVAFKCGIVEKHFVLKYIDDWKSEGLDQIRHQIEECLELGKQQLHYSLAISGITLAKITNVLDKSLLEILSKALQGAASVVAYNFSPHQKAQLLKILKTLVPKQTILAVGDGANDVSMIQSANVGIGIRGKEGREAAKSADFTICQFKHLNRLILYVGQETYRKNSYTIFYNFYKNQSWNLAYIWYNFSCGQSGANIYDQMITQFFNLLYVSLPIIVYALVDEMHPTNRYFSFKYDQPNKLENSPSVYKKHAANPSFNHLNFWKWFVHGSIHSVINIFAAFFIFNANSDTTQKPIDFYTQGLHAFTSCVIVCNLKVMQLHHTHYPFSLIFIFGSIGVYIFSIYIMCDSDTLDSAGDFSILFGNINAYLGFAFAIMASYGFDAAYYIFRADRKKIQEKLESQSYLGIESESKQDNQDSYIVTHLDDDAQKKALHQNLLQTPNDQAKQPPLEGSQNEGSDGIIVISKQLITSDQEISKSFKPCKPMKVHQSLKIPCSSIEGIQEQQDSINSYDSEMSDA